MNQIFYLNEITDPYSLQSFQFLLLLTYFEVCPAILLLNITQYVNKIVCNKYVSLLADCLQ